ncbi:hypothetical protein V8017_19580 [Stenotrophomonas rhizophila]
MALGAAIYSLDKAENIRESGKGSAVTVHLAGDTAALPGTARLLGSSTGFVFLWWPQQQRAEAVPISAIKRMQSVVLPARPAAAPIPPPAHTAR